MAERQDQDPKDQDEQNQETQLNVLGEPLECCCTAPMTGFYRNGRCETGPDDRGLHLVCARMTAEFSAA